MIQSKISSLEKFFPSGEIILIILDLLKGLPSLSDLFKWKARTVSFV